MFWWRPKIQEPKKEINEKNKQERDETETRQWSEKNKHENDETETGQWSETNEKNKHQSDETETGQWNQLPMDLLREVAGKLYFSDYVRFYAVCKNWLASKNTLTVPEAHSLPWHVSIPDSATKVLECQLYQPFSGNPKPTMVLEIPLHQFLRGDNTCSSVYIDIRYGYGWLFLSISNKSDCQYTNFALFSILTKKFETLPPLYHPQGREYALMNTFSSEPDSPNCVFLVVQVTGTNERTISTLRRGEKQWTTKPIHRRHNHFVFLGDDAVYIRGMFYFVSIHGEVASYDITRGDGVWRDERDSADSITNSDDIFRTQQVFQHDEDIFRICIGKEYASRKDLICFIRKFDMSNKVWVAVKSLGGDRALFVNRKCFCVPTIGAAAQKNGVTANNIYSRPLFGNAVHSLDNGKLIDITKGSAFGKWVMDDKTSKITSFWLEPLDHFSRVK